MDSQNLYYLSEIYGFMIFIKNVNKYLQVGKMSTWKQIVFTNSYKIPYTFG